MRLSADAFRAARKRANLIREKSHLVSPISFSLRCGLRPDAWQVAVFRSTAQNVILNCARQSGKSTGIAVFCAFAAVANPGSLTLCVSSERQVKELFYKIKAFLRAAGITTKRTDNANQIELDNGARIVVAPDNPDNVRGFAANIVVCDEASVLSEALFTAVRPMLAVTKGRMFLMATPKGRNNFFARAWFDGGDDWERHMFKAEDNPRISKEFLESERRIMGDSLYRQEYCCEFLESDEAVFSYEATRAAINNTIEVLEI